MKAVNLVLSLLLLVLALAALVFAILLQPRPGQLLGGWKQLATSIQQAAAAIDKDSGSKVGAELASADFSHEAAAGEAGSRQLSETVKKLVTQSRELVTERNALAQNIFDVGKQVNTADLPGEAEFRRIAASAAAAELVNTAVATMIEGRERTYANLAKTASLLGVTLNTRTLRTGNAAGFAPIDKAIADVKGRRAAYEACFQKIETQLGSGTKLNFTGNNYLQVAEGTETVLKEFSRKFSELEASLASVKKANESLKREIDTQNKAISVRDSRIAAQKKTIGDLKVALGLAPNLEAAPIEWAPGSRQSRDVLIGKVVGVDREYGYAELDVGRDTVVSQDIDGKEVTVSPKIDSGLEFFVGRGQLDTSDYIARIRLEEVGDDLSTARIPRDADIQAGDLIFYRRSE